MLPEPRTLGQQEAITESSGNIKCLAEMPEEWGKWGKEHLASSFFWLSNFLSRVPLTELIMKPASKNFLEITTLRPLRFKHIRGQESTKYDSKQASDWQRGWEIREVETRFQRHGLNIAPGRKHSETKSGTSGPRFLLLKGQVRQ